MDETQKTPAPEPAMPSGPSYVHLLDGLEPQVAAGAAFAVEAAHRIVDLLKHTQDELPTEEARELASAIMAESQAWDKLFAAHRAAAEALDHERVMRNASEIKAIMDLGISEEAAFVIAYGYRMEDAKPPAPAASPFAGAAVAIAEYIKSAILRELGHCPGCGAAAGARGPEPIVSTTTGIEEMLRQYGSGPARIFQVDRAGGAQLAVCYLPESMTVTACQKSGGMRPVTADLGRVTCIACQDALAAAGVAAPLPPMPPARG